MEKNKKKNKYFIKKNEKNKKVHPRQSSFDVIYITVYNSALVIDRH